MTSRKAEQVVERLRALYPDAICSLRYEKDYQLLFATRLSAQCTDARVNLITPVLFAAYPTLESLADANPADVEIIVKSSGFYRAKARDIVACARALLDRHGGVVPGDMDALLRLPGVGRKTANLILGDLYNQPAVVADTHCIRISNRLGLAHSSDPYQVELSLKKTVPPAEQNALCHRFVEHGRAVCTARAPQCHTCCLADLCDAKDKKR